MSPREISEAYGIAFNTAHIYAWAIRYPDRFKEMRARMVARRKSKKQPRESWHAVNLCHPEWSLEEERRLQQLLDMRYTFSEIARAMKRTRCAIAGKAARLRKAREAEEAARIALILDSSTIP